MPSVKMLPKEPLLIDGKPLDYLTATVHSDYQHALGGVAMAALSITATGKAWEALGIPLGIPLGDMQATTVFIQFGGYGVTAYLHSYSTQMDYSQSVTTLEFKAVHSLFEGKKKAKAVQDELPANVKEAPHVSPFKYFLNVLDADGFNALEKLCAKKGVTFIWKNGTYTLLAIDKNGGYSITKVEIMPDGFLYVMGHADVCGADGAHDAQINAINLEAMVEMIEIYEPVKADMSALETHSKNVFGTPLAATATKAVKDVLAEGPIQGALSGPVISEQDLAGAEMTLGELLGEDKVDPATYDPSAVKAMGDLLADAIANAADPAFTLPPFQFTESGQLQAWQKSNIGGPAYYKPSPLNVEAAAGHIHTLISSVGIIAGDTSLQALAKHYETGAAIIGPARHTLQKAQVSILYSLLKSMGLKEGYPDFVWLRANVYKLANAENSFGVRFVLRLKNQDLHLGAPHPEACARLLAVAMLEKALHSHKGQVFYYTHGATAEEFTETVLQAITLKLAGSAMEGTMAVKFTKDAVKAAVDAVEAANTVVGPKGKTIKKTAEAVKANAAALDAMKNSASAPNVTLNVEKSDTAEKVTAIKITKDVVPLKDANALGQKVHGTSAGSVYLMAAANDKDGVKLAAKYNGSELSLRLEGNLAKIIGRIKQCGLFVVKGNGEYASVHVSVGNPLQAEMLYASARSVIQANRHIDLAGLVQ